MSISRQPYIYFAISPIVIALHGLISGQFSTLEQLAGTLTILFGLFMVAALLLFFFMPQVVERSSLTNRQKHLLLLDLFLYLVVAAGVFYAEIILLGHSTSKAVHSALGVIIIGYFATIDNALCRQLLWFRNNVFTADEKFRVNPLARRFSLILTITILIIAVSITFTALHDFLGDEAYPLTSTSRMTRFFLIDISTIFGIILALSLRLIHSYTRNLQEFLNQQMDTLRNIQSGNLENRTRIMTHDELGLVAVQINAMIEHLRDREQLHKTLERIVGPNIMEKLLHTDDETLKRGQHHDVAIMFCDMRDFTKMSEAASTEEVLFFVNSFFSELSEIVAKHNGIINKFMGDAILAVYGLESENNPVDDAVRTSLEILEHTRLFTLPDGNHPEMGVGIHYGTVVGGTIGSEQRYEYTFLGDAVNTASRLEGLTKRLDYRLIVSNEAHGHLSMDMQEGFSDLGYHRVRGKSDPVHVFGGEFMQAVTEESTEIR